MKLPESIKVGYQTVKIKIIDHNKDEKLEDSLGCYLRRQGEIRLQEDQSPEELVNSLIHEVLHAAFWVYGMKLVVGDDDKGDSKEELIVNTFANALTQVFRDNPEFLTWIKDHE